MKRAWILIPLIYSLWYVLPREAQPNGWVRFTDFDMCYYAAAGDFHWKAEWHNVNEHAKWRGWSYADWTAVFWKPFTLTDVVTAGWIFFALQFIAYVFLLWKLSEVNYGWIVGLATLKLGTWQLFAGNCNLILSAASVTYVGSALAAYIKPYCLGFVVLNAYEGEVRRWIAGEAAHD